MNVKKIYYRFRKIFLALEYSDFEFCVLQRTPEYFKKIHLFDIYIL